MNEPTTLKCVSDIKEAYVFMFIHPYPNDRPQRKCKENVYTLQSIYCVSLNSFVWFTYTLISSYKTYFTKNVWILFFFFFEFSLPPHIHNMSNNNIGNGEKMKKKNVSSSKWEIKILFNYFLWRDATTLYGKREFKTPKDVVEQCNRNERFLSLLHI